MVSFFQHPFYPYSDVESYTDTRVNVPVPARSKGDAVRQLVLDHWLLALHRQQPQMIFISAGFDAHREDDVGGMGLVEADYTWLTQQMMAVANQYGKGRIVSCLEGGLQPVVAGPQRGGAREGAGGAVTVQRTTASSDGCWNWCGDGSGSRARRRP